MKPWLGACCGLASLLVGCQTYEPQRIDLQEFSASWSTPDFESPAWQLVSEAVGPSGTPDFDAGIGLESATAIALFGNPDLRRARLKAGVWEASAEFAGVWPDPELGFDLLNNLDADEDPWLYGVSLGFTIPLSGRLEVAERQADAHTIEGWRRVAEQEWELIRRVQQVWIKWAVTQHRADALAAYLEEVEPLADLAQALAEAGELAPTEARLLRIEVMQRQLEQIQSQHDAEQQRRALLAEMGLRPDTAITLPATLPEPIDVLLYADAEGLMQQMTQHPRVRSAAARYTLAELNLEREVRKQYPDLKIGPAFEEEDGQSRIGLGLGLPIPLWNANRGGIAEAEAARDVAQAEVEAAYQHAVAEVADSRARWRAAVEMANATRNELQPLVEAQVVEVRALMEIGEVDVLLLYEALSAVVQTRLQVIETAGEEAAAMLDLKELLEPRWVATVAEREEVEHENGK
ncbi:MAG: TolC family protein [Planctomycetota bacterium]